jgi:hypothetical protein
MGELGLHESQLSQFRRSEEYLAHARKWREAKLHHSCCCCMQYPPSGYQQPMGRLRASSVLAKKALRD